VAAVEHVVDFLPIDRAGSAIDSNKEDKLVIVEADGQIAEVVLIRAQAMTRDQHVINQQTPPPIPPAIGDCPELFPFVGNEQMVIIQSQNLLHGRGQSHCNAVGRGQDKVNRSSLLDSAYRESQTFLKNRVV
jgi:hypothetical protein